MDFLDCGNTAVVENGRVNLTDAPTTYGQTLDVDCDIGYQLTGGTKIQCLNDGSWSTYTTCEIVGMYNFILIFFFLQDFLSRIDSMDVQ